MKKEKISQALGNIDAKYIHEAGAYKDASRKVWKNWASVAAAFAVGFACWLVIGAFGLGRPSAFDTPDGEKVTFTVLVGTGVSEELLQSAWNDFAQQSPELQDKEVTLDILPYDGGVSSPGFSYEQSENQKVDLIITNDYDLWYLGENGRLVDLATFGADAYEDLFYEGVWELGKTDTALYGIPISVGTSIYSGKSENMNAANVDLPQTWQEMLTVGATLRESVNGNVFKEMCYAPNSTGSNYTAILPWIWRLGGDIVTEDGTATAINENDALVKALTMLQDLQKYNLLVETSETTGGEDPDEGVFCAVDLIWAQHSQAEREYGLMPRLEEGIPGYSLKAGSCVGVLQQSEQKSLAYDFLEYFVFGTDPATGKMYQELYFENINKVELPALKSLYSKTGFSEAFLAVYTEQLSIAKVLPRTEFLGTCMTILSEAVYDVLSDGKVPARVVAEAEANINAYLRIPDERVPNWDEMPVSQQFSYVEYGENEYSSRMTKLDASYVGAAMDTVVMTGRDQITNEMHTINATLYTVKDFSQECVIAVQFEGREDYYVYVNSYYRPETLGDFIEDLNLRDTVSFGSVWYSFWDAGEYTTVEFVDLADSVVWEMLLSETDVKNVYQDGWSGEHSVAMSISVDIPLLGYQNISLAVTEDGYLTTNILDTGKAFFIGEDKVQAFMDYVIENCEGYELVYKASGEEEGVPEGGVTDAPEEQNWPEATPAEVVLE